jgi:hypothetical protein
MEERLTDNHSKQKYAVYQRKIPHIGYDPDKRKNIEHLLNRRLGSVRDASWAQALRDMLVHEVHCCTPVSTVCVPKQWVVRSVGLNLKEPSVYQFLSNNHNYNDFYEHYQNDPCYKNILKSQQYQTLINFYKYTHPRWPVIAIQRYVVWSMVMHTTALQSAHKTFKKHAANNQTCCITLPAIGGGIFANGMEELARLVSYHAASCYAAKNPTIMVNNIHYSKDGQHCLEDVHFSEKNLKIIILNDKSVLSVKHSASDGNQPLCYNPNDITRTETYIRNFCHYNTNIENTFHVFCNGGNLSSIAGDGAGLDWAQKTAFQEQHADYKKFIEDHLQTLFKTSETIDSAHSAIPASIDSAHSAIPASIDSAHSAIPAPIDDANSETSSWIKHVWIVGYGMFTDLPMIIFMVLTLSGVAIPCAIPILATLLCIMAIVPIIANIGLLARYFCAEPSRMAHHHLSKTPAPLFSALLLLGIVCVEQSIWGALTAILLLRVGFNLTVLISSIALAVFASIIHILLHVCVVYECPHPSFNLS